MLGHSSYKFFNKSTGYESVYMLFTAFGFTPTNTYFVECYFTNCNTKFFFHNYIFPTVTATFLPSTFIIWGLYPSSDKNGSSSL